MEKDSKKTVRNHKNDWGILIGRSPSNKIVIKDRFLEPSHLVITREVDKHYIRLFRGVAGTFTLNHETVTSKTLIKDGDRIEVGKSIIKVKFNPELFLDVYTFDQKRKSVRWILGLIFFVIMIGSGILFWPRLFPDVAAQRYFDQGNILFENGDYVKSRLLYQNTLRIQPNHAEANYRLGLIMEKDGRISQAFGHFLTVVKNDPKHIDGLVRTGRYLFGDNRMAQAMEIANRILVLDPRHKEGGIMRAAILNRQGQEEQAILACKKLIMIDPKHIEAVTLLSTLYEKRGKPVKAVKTYINSLNGQSDNTILSTRLSMLYERINELQNAEKILTNLITTKPEESNRWMWLTDHYMRTKRPDKAINTMEEAIKANPNDHGLRLTLASILQKENHPEKTISVYQDIILKSGGSIEGMVARLGYGEFLLKDGDITYASSLYREVVNSKFKTPQASMVRSRGWQALGRIALSQKEWGEAVDAFRSAVREQPNSTENNNLLAVSLKLIGADEEAKKILEKSTSLNPKDPQSQVLLGGIAINDGNLKEAKKRFRSALSIRPNHFQAMVGLSVVHGRQGDWRSSLETAAQIREKFPKHPIGMFLHGKTSFQLKRYDDSIYTLKIIQKNFPDAIPPQIVLTKSYIAVNKTGEAESLIKKLLKINPKNSEILNLYGEIQASKNESSKAETAFERAIDINRKWLRPRFNLVQLHINEKKTEKAILLLKQAAKEFPKRPEIHLKMATIYSQNRNFKKSMTAYEKVMSLDPKNEAAANNLAMLLINHKIDSADTKKALMIAKRFERSNHPGFLDTLGWAYYKNHDLENAIRILKRSVTIEPDNAEHQYHLGLIYKQAGFKEKAKYHLKISLSTGQKFPGQEAAKKMAESL